MMKSLFAGTVSLIVLAFASPANAQSDDKSVCSSSKAGTTTFYYTPDLFEDAADARYTPQLLDAAFRATAENVAGRSVSSPPFFDEEYKFELGFNRQDPETERLARVMFASFEEQLENAGIRTFFLNTWDAYYLYHTFIRSELALIALDLSRPDPVSPDVLNELFGGRQPTDCSQCGGNGRAPTLLEWLSAINISFNAGSFAVANDFAEAMEESINQVDPGSVDNTARLMSFAAEDDDRAIIVAHGNRHLVASRALNKFRSENPDKAKHAGVLGSGIFGDRPTGQANRYVNTTDDKILDILAEQGRNIPSRNATNAFFKQLEQRATRFSRGVYQVRSYVAGADVAGCDECRYRA